MKDELSGKIMWKWFEVRVKTFSYVIDDGSEDKKARGIKKVCHKRKTYIWKL